jgi:hypothetical protein
MRQRALPRAPEGRLRGPKDLVHVLYTLWIDLDALCPRTATRREVVDRKLLAALRGRAMVRPLLGPGLRLELRL